MAQEIARLRRSLERVQARNLTLERRLEAQEREIIYLRGGLSTAHFRLGQLLFGAPGRVSDTKTSLYTYSIICIFL